MQAGGLPGAIFVCADTLSDLHLVIQQDDMSGDRGGGHGQPGQQRVMIGPPPSSLGADPVPKTQLAMVRLGEDMCYHLIALE
jgi:hypothetical protein